MVPAAGPGRLGRGRQNHDDSESCNGSYIKTIDASFFACILVQIWLAGLAANLARCVLGWRILMQNPRLRKASRIGLDSSKAASIVLPHVRNALFAAVVLNALTVQFTPNLVEGGRPDTWRDMIRLQVSHLCTSSIFCCQRSQSCNG